MSAIWCQYHLTCVTVSNVKLFLYFMFIEKYHFLAFAKTWNCGYQTVYITTVQMRIIQYKYNLRREPK